jgi:hypothetical protein
LSFDSEDDDENFWSSSLPTCNLSVMIVQQISLYKSVDYREDGIVAHSLHHSAWNVTEKVTKIM